MGPDEPYRGLEESEPVETGGALQVPSVAESRTKERARHEQEPLLHTPRRQ